jgi:hypothetical protein
MKYVRDSFSKLALIILRWLNKPISFPESQSVRFIICFSFGLYTFIFLEIFKPFDLDIIKRNSSFYILAYALVVFFVLLLFFVIQQKAFPGFFRQGYYNYSKFIIMSAVNIFTISLFCWLFSKIYCKDILSSCSLFRFTLNVLSIGLLPILLLAWINEKIQLKKSLNLAEKQIRQKMDIISITQNESLKQVNLLAPNGTIWLKLILRNFIFAQSNGNYIIIHYFDKGVRKKQIVRMTITKLLEQLEKDQMITQCHRSFVINMIYVTEVKGNTHSREYYIESIKENVPVSRKYARKPAQYFTLPRHC